MKRLMGISAFLIASLTLWLVSWAVLDRIYGVSLPVGNNRLYWGRIWACYCTHVGIQMGGLAWRLCWTRWEDL